MAAIRPLTEADHEAWVSIRNEIVLEPLTVDLFRRNIARPLPFVRRLVAEDGGRVVGIGSILDTEVVRPCLMVLVQVTHGERGKGLGDQLLAALRSDVPVRADGEQGDIRDDDPGTRRWAEARGFAEADHRFESRLDLEDWRAPAGLTAIEVDESNDHDLVFKLFASFSADTPDDFQVPTRDWFDSMLADHVRAFVARRSGGVVGMALLEMLPEGRAINAMTGVVREARGQGIALALKAAVIERARELGVRRLVTMNNARNAPMLAVNKRLGYERLPGWLLMRRRF